MLFSLQQMATPKKSTGSTVDPPGVLSRDLRQLIGKDTNYRQNSSRTDLECYLSKKKRKQKRSQKRVTSQQEIDEMNTATVVTWIRCNDSVAEESRFHHNTGAVRPKPVATVQRTRSGRSSKTTLGVDNSRFRSETIGMERADDVDQTSTTTSSSRRSEEVASYRNLRYDLARAPSVKAKKSSRQSISKMLASGEGAERQYIDRGEQRCVRSSPQASTFPDDRPSSVHKKSSRTPSHGSPPRSAKKVVMVKGYGRLSKPSATPRSRKPAPSGRPAPAAPPLDFSEFEADDFSLSPIDMNTRTAPNSFANYPDSAIDWNELVK